MITCEEFTNRVTEYLEGSVPRGERFGMWLHLVLCHHCRRYLRQMKEVVDLLHDVPHTPQSGSADKLPGADEATKAQLLEQFRKSRGPSGE